MTEWKPNTYYKIGDIVTYDLYYYKCIQAHTSIVTWEPSIDTQALWDLLEDYVPPAKPPTTTPPETKPPTTTPPETKPPTTTPPETKPPTTTPQPTQNTTMLAPYLYTWGYNNSVYKINKCMDIVNKVQGNAATIAFVIGSSTDDIINTFKSDFAEFQKKGGQLILSFGGASGQYMEDVLSIDQMVNEVSKFIDTTGCKALDFDIEGSYLANQALNIKRAQIIYKLQDKYPGLYTSFTLPADTNGLSNYGISLLTITIQNGVKIDVVNIMAMDIGQLPDTKSWGLVAAQMGDTTVNQLQRIYPQKSRNELYRMLGITVMIGQNDDGSIFKPYDAKFIGDYAKRNNIGLLSFWSINRDQIGTGDLGVYSQYNTKDFEYFNNMKNALGALGTLPGNGVPVPNDTWIPGNRYKVGDIVIYNGKNYKYVDNHIATNELKPSMTPSLWQVSL